MSVQTMQATKHRAACLTSRHTRPIGPGCAEAPEDKGKKGKHRCGDAYDGDC